MAYELIRAEKKNHLTTLTLNRPEAMNAISPLVSAALSTAFDDFNEGPKAFTEKRPPQWKGR